MANGNVASIKNAQPVKVDLGENIDAVVEGDTLTMKINLKSRGEESKSGKSVIVATTSGNVTVPGTKVVLGVNAYVKK